MTVDRSPVTPARSPARSRLAALFVVYLALLVWTVLWKLEVPWVGGDRMVKLVPFVATDGAGASAPLEVVVNLLLFVPFGLYLGLLVPARRWWALAGVVAGSSLALEVGQYVLAVGRSDTTDVVVNTAGGLVGLGLAAVRPAPVGGRRGPGDDAGLLGRDGARPRRRRALPGVSVAARARARRRAAGPGRPPRTVP